jgi:sulfofructose kinase
MACSCWDMLGTVEHYPALDEKVGMKELIEQGGGLTATALAAVGKLGGRAAMLGNVGDDSSGQKIIAALQDVGVDTTHLRVISGTRSRFAFCIIHEATGQRSIFFDTGTAGTPEPDEIGPDLIARARVVLIDGTTGEGGLRCAGIACEQGKPVVLDVERTSAGSDELLRLATHPVVPGEYAASFAESAAPLDGCRAIQQMGPHTVVATLGDRGCVAVEGEAVHRVPAFDVPVVDTTGAGDVFHGAFAYGLALGKPLAENLVFASAAAAISCRALGGRAGLATLSEVEDLIAQGQTRPIGPS